MDEKWTIDRIEGDMAVLEDPAGEPRYMPLGSLPRGAREGMCLRRDEDGNLIADMDEESLRRKAFQDRLKRLYKR
nr:DUF3006 domain-containing protein [bacterium]